MMMYDRRGIAIAAASTEAVDAFDRMVTAFLGHGRATPDLLDEVLRLDDSLPLAFAARGHFLLLLGQRRLQPLALESLARAKELTDGCGKPPREAALTQSLAQLLSGNQHAAVATLEAWLERQPLDALAVKLSHAWQFVLGESHGMRRSADRHLAAWDDTVPDYGFLLGCHAFALEETGDYAMAEAVGRRGVSLEPCDAWGFHAVAHTLEMRDKPQEGVTWLEANLPAVCNCNAFGEHVYWHLALFHLSLGDHDAVVDLYDREVRREHLDDYRCIANGASLLWRMEAEGIDVGNRWAELAELAASHVGDHANVFADAHYMLSLIGANRLTDAEQFVRSAGSSAATATDTQSAVHRAVGLALAEALLSIGKGQHSLAVQRLAPLRGAVVRIGGSHAQRDVFNQLLIDTAIRSGDAAMATQLLDERTAGRPANAWAHNRQQMVASLETTLSAGAA